MAVGDENSGNGATLTIDCMSPYFIQSGDKPGDVFVTSLLRDGNYGDWLDEMSNALYAKNKIGFVNGDIPMPASNSPYLPYWQRANAMVKAWLNSSMELELRQSVKFKTAREIWVDLDERFGKESAPRAYELRCALGAVRQEGQSVSAYFSRLRRIWDEMASISKAPSCNCGKCTCNLTKHYNEARDRDHLYDFLMGLEEYYGPLKSQILATRPIPTLTAAYHLISEAEHHRNIVTTRKTGVENAAFQAQVKTAFDPNKKLLGGKLCTHCGRTNHTVDSCFEIVGYPSNWNLRGKEQKQQMPRTGEGRSTDRNSRSTDRGRRGSGAPKAAHVDSSEQLAGLSADQLQRLAQFMRTEFDKQGPTSQNSHNMQVNMAGTGRFDSPWIIDSGASEHITCDDRLLTDIMANPSESPVRIPNGLTLEEADWGG
ncbi:unnamed protein product [Cuscuta epithymum]|uniref:Retrotransposon Copia-like N-terminal domain-containing protein n=1 Tax=Cuscuta epithymum TaxID=186058 RepID=A0AAV0DEI4_9ASTE|nr:unnamed protein product [Cuscuta epithymum]